VEQVVQIVGALFVLIGFALAQLGRLDHHSRPYLIVNLVGSIMLSVDAAIGRQLGFLLLEGVWALVSAWGLTRLVIAQGRPRADGAVPQRRGQRAGVTETGPQR
jgi:hypothetical protein